MIPNFWVKTFGPLVVLPLTSQTGKILKPKRKHLILHEFVKHSKQIDGRWQRKHNKIESDSDDDGRDCMCVCACSVHVHVRVFREKGLHGTLN